MNTKSKLYAILLLAGLLLVFGVYFVSSRAYIAINVPGAVQGSEVSYTLYNQGSKQTTSFTSSPDVRRLVPTGTYEVTVRQDGQSYLAIVDNGRFFSTTTVTAGLSGEKARSFVGNNSKSCIHLVDGTLLSIPCGDTIKNLQIHKPANATLPTFTTKASSPLEGYVESMLRIKGVNYALIKAPADGEDQGAPHTLYALTKDGITGEGRVLAGLSASQTYEAEPYRDGLLVYSLAGDSLLYYPEIGSQPVRLSVDKPKDSNLIFNLLNISGDSLVLAYSNNQVRQIPGSLTVSDEDIPLGSSSDKKKTAETSELLVFTEGQTNSYQLEGSFDNVRLCGTAKICVLNEGLLSVYATGGGELEPQYELAGVSAIEAGPSGLLVIRNEGIMNFDVETRQGSVEYSLGTYEFCGMRPVEGGYIVCTANKDGRKAALYINQTEADTDTIDKKVAQLLDDPAVKDVSVYGTYIYVSPELGERTYNSALNGYVYSAESKRNAAAAIDRKVDDLQIDRAHYTIVNTIQ